METQRLLIRPLQPEDWPHMQQIAEDFRKSPGCRYDRPLPAEPEILQPLVQRFAESGLFFTVFPKGEAQMAGYVNFHKQENTFHLGYCFHSASQGKGYARESCTALLQHLRSENPGCRFQAGAALENTPSCRLLKKLGFVQTGQEQVSFHQDEDGNPIFFTGGIFELP